MQKFLGLLAVLAVFLFASFGLASAGDASLEKDLVKTLRAGERIAVQAVANQKKGTSAKKELEELRGVLEQIQAADLLMTERQRLQAEKARGFGGKALERQQHMERLYRESVDELVGLLKRMSQDRTISPSDLERLQSLLQTIAPKKESPILGSLPYKNLRYPANQPITLPQVTPAYRGGNGVVSPADLQATTGSKVSAEIATLAQSLNWSPVAIYEWVKNNIATEWYRGSMKGAEETLRQKSGNDADQAVLLVALLRASNYPARYVQGVIEFFPEGLDKVKNLTGVSDPEKLGEFFQRAGIPFQKVMAGNSIVNYQIEHIWVEAEIPYSNYRGVLADAQGKVWLGLDTSIKVAGYTRTPGPIDLFAEAGNPIATLRDNYLATAQTLTPLEYLQGQTQPYLNQYHFGLQYKDIFDSSSLKTEALSILPASLQFKEVAITGEYAQLPDSLLHKVRFVGKNSADFPILDVTLGAQDLSSRKVILNFEPETVEDQEIINAWGGLDNTPSYLVRLRPVLLVGEERIAVGKEGFAMGEAFTLSLAVTSPNGTEMISNSVHCGYPQALGIVAQKTALPAPETLQNVATDLLYREVLNYIDGWNRGEDELAALLKVAVVRPIPTVVTMGGMLDVITLMGVPQGVEWKGLFVDADLRAAEPVSKVLASDEREKVFMQLSALQGSALENAVFERAFAVESISTAKLLGIAKDSGISLLTIDANNVDTVLPTLGFASNVKADIASAVSQGLVVRIPQTELSAMAWTGVGYIKENPATGEAGYMLSGAIAGGATILGLSAWPAELMQALTAPFSGEPNGNAGDAYKITEITPWSLKLATAGEELSGPLMVIVRDVNNVPVRGATVAFTVRVGGGTLIDDSQSSPVQVQTATVETDSRGIATMRFVPGQSTYVNPIAYLRDGDVYSNIVGQNLIDAKLQTGSMSGLQSPIAILGFAGEPATMGVMDSNWFGHILSFLSKNTGAILKDKFDNPVANAMVTLESMSPSLISGNRCPVSGFPDTTKKAQLTINKNCINAMSSYNECQSDTGYMISGKTLSSGSFSVGVILGGVPWAKYPIRATYSKSGTGTASLEATSYHKTLSAGHHNYVSFEQCGEGLTSSELYLKVNRPTAKLAGSSAKISLKSHVVWEGLKNVSTTINCENPTTSFQCQKTVGNRIFSIKQLESFGKKSVVFSSGNSSTQMASNSELGLFETIFTLPSTPGINNFSITATATETRKMVSGTSCPSTCGTLSDYEEAYSDVGNSTIYGVVIDVPKILSVPISVEGYGLQDLIFNFNILPANYAATFSQVLMYRDGRLVYVAPGAKSGSSSISIPAGYWFDRNSTYTVEVLLNNPSDSDEMRSVQVPIIFGDFVDFGGNLSVQRTHLVSAFDATVPATVGSDFVDSFQVFPFTLNSDRAVKVTILDENRKEKAILVPEVTLPAGEHNFVVDFEQVRNAGFDIADSPAFHIRLDRRDPSNNSVSSTFYDGRLSEVTTTAKMLGQTLVHDVLIQDGSLNLSRQDLAFQGRGPQLAFSRSYNNQYSPRGVKPLGRGWSHSLDLRAQVLSTSSMGSLPVPAWVTSLKGRFYNSSEVPNDPRTPTMVQVNGTIFKLHNGNWYAERSKHGKLTSLSNGLLFTAKDGTRYRYDHLVGGDLLVSAIEDRNGNALTFAYTPTGQLDKATDAVGRELVFTYQDFPQIADDSISRLVSVAGPDGVLLEFSYDANGYLASAKRGARVESYGYAQEAGIKNGEFNLDRSTDVNGQSSRYEYFGPREINQNLANFTKVLKSQDIVKSVVYPDDRAANFTYDVATANKRVVTDLRGNPTTYTLNFYGNPTKIEEPLGKVTQMTWSMDEAKSDNVMTSRTDPRGYRTSYEHDSRGNVTKETDPYSNSVLTSWNQEFSLPESRTDRNLVLQSWKYDVKGNLEWHDDGEGKRTSYAYYPTGEVQTLTDPRGFVTSYSYDQYGNSDTVSGPEGSITNFDYDIRGRKVAETDPLSNKTSYAYDDLDYPASITYPAITLPAGSSNFKTFSYDPVGNLLSETDRVGLTLDYTYTPRNQVERISRSAGGVKAFGYDGNGNLLSESDWKGAATTHIYDALNRRDGTTNRLGHSMSMVFDLAGNLIQTTDHEGRTTDYEYDKLNRQTKVIQPALPSQARGEIVTTYFNEADPKTNVKSVTDAQGHTTTFEYNGRYQKTMQTNALNGIYQWAFDAAGNLASETDEELRVTSYIYDKQNRQLTRTQPLGIVATYSYDPAGNRTHVIDARGNDTETHYDAWNRATTVVDPDNYSATTELDGEGREVKVTNGNGHARSWVRDPRGLVLSATDAEQKATIYTYDLNGNVETITNPRGFVTRIGYDGEDRKLLTTEAEGTAEVRTTGVLAYDKVGNPLQARDGNGNITITDYNALNLPGKVYAPAPFGTLFSEASYDKNGKVKSVRNRRGHVTSYEYDPLGRQTKVTDPAPFSAQSVVTTYDKVGNVKTVTDKRGIVTDNTYDALNRLTEQTRAGVRLVTNEYDGVGNLKAVIDANNHRTGHSYNKRNLLETTTFADSYSQSRTYDGVGNLLTLTDEEGKTTTYTYDKERRETSVTFAGETTTKVYDQVGNLAQVVKPKGNGRTLSYDGLNRLATVAEGSLTTTYTYDGNNNLLTQQDPRGNRVEYLYDALNRKTKHIQHKGTGNLTVSYDSYDGEGNLTQMTDAKGQVFSYAYDALNRRTDSTYPLVVTPFLTLKTVHTEYDGNNNITGITETKQTDSLDTVTDTTVNSYDNFDRLKTSDQRGMPIGYDYDNNGNRTRVFTAAAQTNYTFGNRNRLETASVGSDVTTYGYTPKGRQQWVTYPNGTRSDTSHTPADRVETIAHKKGDEVISSYAYGYDPNGNRTSQTEVQGGLSESTTYVYDDLDRLESYTLASGADTTATSYSFEGYNRKTETVVKNGSTLSSKTNSYDETDWLMRVEDGPRTISYSYDANGNTIGKSDSAQPGESWVFDYDAGNRLVQTKKGLTLFGQYDYNAQGLRVRHYGSERGNVEYFYDDGAVIEEFATGAQGGLLAHYRYADRLLSLDAPGDGGVQYYHHDALGSTVSLTDSAGGTKVSYTLDPWGHIRNQIGNSVNRQIFTGQEHDEKTGLIYFGARYYDPDTARFINQDSYLGETGTPPSLHRYLYAYSNPLAYIDPDGHAGYFFDGTGNHPHAEIPKGEADYTTNVHKLYDAYKGQAYYAYGIGSGFEANGTPYKETGLNKKLKVVDEQITGETMDSRVDFMLKMLDKQISKGDLTVDLFGFSRGGASALEFLNRIDNERSNGNEMYSKLEIRFVGLFDVVPSMRKNLFQYSNDYEKATSEKNWLGFNKKETKNYKFSLPDGLNYRSRPVHLVSIDERRKEFATVDLQQSLQVGFRGVHSDVGGSYDKNLFDWMTRDFMVKKSKEAGVSWYQDKLDSNSRWGEVLYNKWLTDHSRKNMSPASPTDNSAIHFNDNENRRLPPGMLLHPSVPFFEQQPLNDISQYRYLP